MLSLTLPSTHLNPFFRGDPALSKLVAGSRRSACPARPSARIIDPNNHCVRVSPTPAEGSPRATRRAKLTGSDDESEHDNEMDDVEVDTEMTMRLGRVL